MTERERLLCVLNRKEPDKTPWFADLSYLYGSMEATGTLDSKYLGETGYLEFHKDLGAGIYLYAPFPWKSAFTEKVIFETVKSGSSRIMKYSTPVGSIFSEERFLSKTYSWAITKHFVHSLEDLKIMLYIHENTVFSENFNEFKRIDDLWGDYGLATALPPISVSPYQKLLARWAGIENTVCLYMDHPDEFEAILAGIGISENPVYDILCNSPAQYIEFAENLSSEITGTRFFNMFNADYYKNRNNQLHKAGKFTGIHIDGTLTPCLSMLEESGFDVAEAVTPYPAGDLHITELRKSAGNNIIIWGGLPGILFSPLYSEEQFISHIKELLETFPPGSGFILGVADQVPPDGLVSRIGLVREILGE